MQPDPQPPAPLTVRARRRFVHLVLPPIDWEHVHRYEENEPQFTRCETAFPLAVCTCGLYQLTWEEGS